MQRFKALSQYLTLLFATVTFAAQAAPEITLAQATQVLSRYLEQNPLYWNPFPFPYEITQKNTDKDAKLLAALLKHQLVKRESLKIEIGKVDGRPVYELRWLYDYAPKRVADATEGFYYGKAALIDITQMSAPGGVKGKYYVALEYRWKVVNFQSWAGDNEFRIARTLRRSKTSASQPFESKIYLQYNPQVQSWQVWDEDY